jgi:hypothetical protein
MLSVLVNRGVKIMKKKRAFVLAKALFDYRF